MTCFPLSSRFRHHKNYVPISGHHSFSLGHSHFFNLLLTTTVLIMSPVQALPSFSLALRPDHYTTVLPNPSYPSRPITHIPWSGSSRPLLFSVSQTSFFLLVLPQPYFFSRKRRVQSWQLLLVFLSFKLVIFLPQFTILTLTYKRTPFINSRFLILLPLPLPYGSIHL